MTEKKRHHIFLSYSQANQDLVEALARRLHGDVRPIRNTPSRFTFYVLAGISVMMA
jgi:hypothetical protein